MTTAEFVTLPLEGLVIPEPDLVDLSEPVADAAVAEGGGTAVVRHVEAGSVLKLSLAFYVCAWAVLVVAGILLWIAAEMTGVVTNIEQFMRDIGFAGFRFRAGLLLSAGALGGLVLVGAGTIANMLAAMLFNLLSDVVGGIKVTIDRR